MSQDDASAPGAGGVVAAGHEATVKVAGDVLRAGGNAFDAAVAGMFAACVAEPVLASLGGGGFLMARTADGACCRLYDFFAQTPRSRRPDSEAALKEIVADFGPAQQAFHIGAGAAATPGFLPGLAAVHRDLGKLDWQACVTPAAQLARQGLTVTAFQAYLATVVKPILTASPEAEALHAPDGELLRAGDRFTNPALGETLEQIATDGPVFVEAGPLAAAIVAQSTAEGGHLNIDDLTAYEVIIREPLRLVTGSAEAMLNPAPAAGGALVALGLAALGEETVTANALITAMELVNAVRQETGSDPERIVQHPTVAAHLRSAAGHPQSHRGTTHLSVVDQEGNAAAVTVSNGEGNGLLLGETGVMLNNMLGEEDVLPDGLGSWAPDVRLSSMMAPTIVVDDDGGVTALGSGGSNRIRTALMQVIGRLSHGNAHDLESAVMAPRLHLEKNGAMSFEDFLSEPDRTALLDRYPDAKPWAERNMFFGGVHAVHRAPDGTVHGFGDPRRDGTFVAG